MNPRRVRRRRRRGPQRHPIARWTGRLLGLVATAVVLAAGVVALDMVRDAASDDDETAARAASPTADEGGGKPKAGAKDAGPRLSKADLAARRAAVAVLREQGYDPLALEDYRPQQQLRVLVGKPRGGTPPGRRGFFFVGDRYIGQDATAPTMHLRPGRQLDREITLVYTLYEAGDRACCPKGGDFRVHFRWTGSELVPREEIPPETARMPPL